MGILRRRPTALVWYSRIRGLNIILLAIAASFYVVLLVNPHLGRSETHKEPLVAVIIAAIPNAFELRNAALGEVSAPRSRRFLISLMVVDIFVSMGLCISAFTTGASTMVDHLLLSALACTLFALSVLHIIATSFVCCEEIMRHKQMAKQKNVEQENGMHTELETIAASDLQAGGSGKPGDAKSGRGEQN